MIDTLLKLPTKLKEIDRLAEEVAIAAEETVSHVQCNGYALDDLKARKKLSLNNLCPPVKKRLMN